MKELGKYSESAIDYIMTNGPKVIMAIVVLIIGLRIIKVLTRQSARIM